MIIMKCLDKILVLLQDSKWHKLDEINEDIPVSTLQLKEIIYFLQERSFIINEKLELKITIKGLRFLDLPV